MQLKDTVTEMKSSVDGLKRMVRSEERISELKNRSIEITLFKQQTLNNINRASET